MRNTQFLGYDRMRGGHAPHALRREFLDAIDIYSGLSETDPLPVAQIQGREFSLSQLCGLLWNCTDYLPNVEIYGLELIGIEGCRTYSQAARAIRAELRE